MSETRAAHVASFGQAPALSQPRGQWLPLLMLLFVGSGAAALIYETVWFQLLEFAIGSSAYSIGVLLGTFMGGMCLGSLLFSRLVKRGRDRREGWHPLAVYGALELGIGALGLAVTLGMPLIDKLYVTFGTPGASGFGWRAVVCAVCLLPPTVLMGATLPAISRWVESTPKGVSWLGFFYGGNTAGAVGGCLLAGFYLLKYFDMHVATFVAVAINLAVGGAAMALARGLPAGAGDAEGEAPMDVVAQRNGAADWGRWGVYVAIGLSGMAALGAEVVWTRLLALTLGATVYNFSIILAVFLLGLGIGSSAAAAITRFLVRGAKGAMRSQILLGWAQICCAVGVAWTAYAITNKMQDWDKSADFVRTLWGILPATIFWGASFPLALAAVAREEVDPAQSVGRLYAANTVGAIFGALLFALVLIPGVGTAGAEQVLMLLAGLGAVAAIVPGLIGEYLTPPVALRAGAAGERGSLGVTGMLVTLLAAVLVPLAAEEYSRRSELDKVPGLLVAWGRNMKLYATDKPVYMGEGINSSVAVTETFWNGETHRQFHVAGKCEASTIPVDMRLQYMLGHYPALLRPEAKSVLIVGCGAGVTAGSFIPYLKSLKGDSDFGKIERIVICEIEPLIPPLAAKYFGPQNNDVVSRKENGDMVEPRVQIVFDDARHFILTTHEKFDIITSDPIHPWVKGAATLYSKEYFDLVKQHLKPGGLVTQWVPLYESDEPSVKSEIATFFKVFPGGVVWNNGNGGGYDTVVMGGNEPVKVDMNLIGKRLEENTIVRGLLGRAFIGQDAMMTLNDVKDTYGGTAEDLAPWMADAQINEDKSLRLQYLAGAAYDKQEANDIIDKILSYKRPVEW